MALKLKKSNANEGLMLDVEHAFSSETRGKTHCILVDFCFKEQSCACFYVARQPLRQRS